MKAKVTEEEIAAGLVTYLRDAGHEVWQEVQTSRARADVVAKLGPVVTIFEVKVSWGLALADQLSWWLYGGFAHRIVGVAAGQPAMPLREWARMKGLGVWSGLHDFREQEKPRIVAREAKIVKALRDEHRSGDFAAAGASCGGHWTQWKNTMRAVERHVGEHPGCTIKDAVDVLGKMHYSNTSSARAGIATALRTGLVKTMRVDMTQQPFRLYPLTPPAAR